MIEKAWCNIGAGNACVTLHVCRAGILLYSVWVCVLFDACTYIIVWLVCFGQNEFFNDKALGEGRNSIYHHIIFYFLN